MKTVRRLFYYDIVSSVAFVAVAFLSLFFFIDFLEELSSAGKRGYTALHAFGYSLLEVPGHLYELAPIAVLIGTIYALSRLAQSSEYTILRTGGLGPSRALSLLTGLGLLFGGVTFVVGDYIAPWSEQQAEQLKAKATGGVVLGAAGVWLKDRQSTALGEHTFSINIASTEADGTLRTVRIFEFNPDGRLVRRMAAQRAVVDENSQWTLTDVDVTEWPTEPAPMAAAERTTEPSRLWQSGLSASVVASAVMPLSTMTTLDLLRYVDHLSNNEQAAQRYEIQFWKRALYPLACLVMVGLALPFAYVHARNGGISLRVFGGIMLGISYVLLNNLSGHVGLLRDWTPWVAAATPSALYMVMSLAAFAWLVRYR